MGGFASRQVLIEAVVRRMLAVANAALDEVDLSGDPAGALERLVHATWRLILRSGSLLVAAEKALPAVTVRQAHAGGLEERVRSFIATSQASGAFRSDLSAGWLMAVFAAIIHAAANEMDSLDAAEASATITSTMLAPLGCQNLRDASHYFRFQQRSPLRTDDSRWSSHE